MTRIRRMNKWLASVLLLLLLAAAPGCQSPGRIEFDGTYDGLPWSEHKTYEEGWAHTNENGRTEIHVDHEVGTSHLFGLVQVFGYSGEHLSMTVATPLRPGELVPLVECERQLRGCFPGPPYQLVTGYLHVVEATSSEVRAIATAIIERPDPLSEPWIKRPQFEQLHVTARLVLRRK